MFSRLFLRTIKKVSSFPLHNFTFKAPKKIKEIPMLDEFLKKEKQKVGVNNENSSDLFNDPNFIKNAYNTDYDEKLEDNEVPVPKKFIIETYGCQMNESDTEIINSIMTKNNYIPCSDILEADIVLINTCAIRENAEKKIWNRLEDIKGLKKSQKYSFGKKRIITGVLGCMAERLKEKLLERSKVVDLIIGPDAYRSLPSMLAAIENSSSNPAINVQLSFDETYSDITPLRLSPSSIKASVSIMRGCNNMCAFCIVPFTRGRERSRPIESILEEVRLLKEEGVKEILLLGQNVNSYFDELPEEAEQVPNDQKIENDKIDESEDVANEMSFEHENSEGFREMYKKRGGKGWRFAQLLQKAAEIAPEVRFRFTSPHPKNFPDSVLEVIKKYPNICKNIHLPAQSGNTQVLSRMRRNYTRDAYLNLVAKIKEKIPDITLSSDFICGFCGETEEEFEDTISLMEKVKFEQAYLFAYSMRERTHAHRNFTDDVLPAIKQQRLEKMIETFHKHQKIVIEQEKGRFHLVLIEGTTKYEGQLRGRTDGNRPVIIRKGRVAGVVANWERMKQMDFSKPIESMIKDCFSYSDEQLVEMQVGDFIIVYVEDVSTRSLFGRGIVKSSISEFAELSGNKAFIEKNGG